MQFVRSLEAPEDRCPELQALDKELKALDKLQIRPKSMAPLANRHAVEGSYFMGGV